MLTGDVTITTKADKTITIITTTTAPAVITTTPNKDTNGQNTLYRLRAHERI
jgi:hypothetical protein